jgi:hypothetical protein
MKTPNDMKTRNSAQPNGEPGDDLADELRPEYDATSLKNGVRGKYLSQYRSGTNLVLLAPDVAASFPTEQSVNEALRRLMRSQEAA